MSDSAIAAQADMLRNRLAKSSRHLARWARREDIGAYRVYDCDIPELPLTVDRYAARDGDFALVAVWDGGPPKSEAWLGVMGEVIAATLAVPSHNVIVKVRARQEGLAQYERLDDRAERHVVREHGLAFLVNLVDYLDTGLFLDHRPLRRRVGAEAKGKRVLNLFGYTGAFTVHAAAGGASATTTVDLSATYLDWANDNLALNHLTSPAHALVRADVLQWLEAPTRERWDLAVVDPPTFSNSKKMRGVLDVQRDHAALIARVCERMAPGGVVYFSTNARRFKPDPDAFAPAKSAREISPGTIPPDFRDKKIHRAWRLELP